jgi:hypothetical protein
VFFLVETNVGSRKFEIARGETLRIDPLAGDSLHVRLGEVWITQFGDPKDYLMKPGESLILNHEGAVLAVAYKLTLLDLLRNDAGPGRTERRPMRASGWRAPRLLGKIIA